MTLLVRDEEDIIKWTIDYHLKRGVDFIIATDNRSVDGTAEILLEYQRRGLLHYIYQADDDFSQSRWVTRMARMAYTKFHADWVINSDADEFWWPEGSDLPTTFQNLDQSSEAIAVERTNFVPRTRMDGAIFAEAMTYRERCSTNVLGQPLPQKVCHRAFVDISVAQGNHSVSRDGQALSTVTAPLTILHFPMRTYQQFANKISKGGAAYARNTELPPEAGRTWRQLYSLWQAGQLRDSYNSSVFDDLAIEKGLRDGSLLFDDRLSQFLSSASHIPMLRFGAGVS